MSKDEQNMLFSKNFGLFLKYPSGHNLSDFQSKQIGNGQPSLFTLFSIFRNFVLLESFKKLTWDNNYLIYLNVKNLIEDLSNKPIFFINWSYNIKMAL